MKRWIFNEQFDSRIKYVTAYSVLTKKNIFLLEKM